MSVGRLFVSLVGWPAGWLAGWLVGGLVGWLVGRLVGSSVCWLVSWSVGWYVHNKNVVGVQSVLNPRSQLSLKVVKLRLG